MKYFIAVACLAVIAAALPVDQPEPLPFHYSSSGDVDGSYSYTYTAEDSSKTETRDAEGNIFGGFQYIDSEGKLQKWQYKATAEDGIQILASNLPVGSTDPVTELPEVQRAAEEHFHAVQKSLQLIVKARAAQEAYERKLAHLKLQGRQ